VKNKHENQAQKPCAGDPAEDVLLPENRPGKKQYQASVFMVSTENFHR